MSKFISVASPSITRKEIKAVVKVMKSGGLAQGPVVNSFEKSFSKLVWDRKCIAVNSGTSALHVSVLALGIGKGDEVIVPSFTFAATPNTVALAGAKPVFVDIDLDTFCISPKAIEDAITKKTKAIQVVHLYGRPADMISINKIAKKHNLYVIEDAAQAHGAEIDLKPVGTFGDVAAFSFYPTKNMTSGEGGMVVTESLEVERVSRLLRNQGMEKRYENEIVGYNLRMTDIHAAIGLAQIERLHKFNQKRIENAKFLNKNLSNVVVPKEEGGITHVYHQYTVRVVGQDRDEFSKQLESCGIGSGVYYPIPTHKLASFNTKDDLPNTDRVCKEVLSLPVHPDLSKKDLEKIVKCVNKIAKAGS